MIDIGEESGGIESAEREMIQNVLSFPIQQQTML